MSESKVKSAAQLSYMMPSWDANSDVSIDDLIGTNYAPGELAQLRYNDYVVQPIFQAVRRHMQGLVWRVHPADDSRAGIAAAKVIENALLNLDGGWPAWVARVHDSLAWAGHACYECIRVEDPDSPLGYSWKLTWIFPTTIQRLHTDQSGTRLQSVTQQTDRGMATFEANEFVWYRNTDIPGNFMGESMLRPLLVIKRAAEADLKTYIHNRLQSRGLYKVQTTGEPGSKGKEEFKRTVRTLNDAISGKAGWFIVPQWMDVTPLPSLNAPEKIVDVWQYYDAIRRGALGHYVENMGLTGSGSNRALAEVLEVADEERWEATLSELETFANSQGLLPFLRDHYEIPDSLAPRVTIYQEPNPVDLDEALARIEKLHTLYEQGAISAQEFASMKSETLRREDSYVEEETARITTLLRSMETP